jgi:hypothetical protein
MRCFVVGFAIVVVLVGFDAVRAPAAITQLTSPAQFTGAPTTINFDGYPHRTVANTLYSGQGVTLTRDDGLNVFLYDYAAMPRNTTSPPNIIGTPSGPGVGSWATHLNALFTSPTFEVVAYFGNDVSPVQNQLSVFDASNQLLGTVGVANNRNLHVDQFIGLRSDVPFVRARFLTNDSGRAVALDDFMFSQGIIPEPSTFLVWSLLATLTITFGWRQRRRR